MLTLAEIKQDTNLINTIDWEMTPEEAIALHLEWGPLRSQSYYNSRDNSNETVYFTISTWKEHPIITLVRRIGFDASELATIDLPEHLEEEFNNEMGKFKGVFAVEGNIKQWLKDELEV